MLKHCATTAAGIAREEFNDFLGDRIDARGEGGALISIGGAIKNISPGPH